MDWGKGILVWGCDSAFVDAIWIGMEGWMRGDSVSLVQLGAIPRAEECLRSLDNTVVEVCTLSA